MQQDRRYFHLTPRGWIRQDHLPYPQDRVETWVYEIKRPAEDAEEEATLVQLWSNPAMKASACDALRAWFAQTVMAATA
jgi:hypothetical protein